MVVECSRVWGGGSLRRGCLEMLETEKLGAGHGTVFAIELEDQEQQGLVINRQLLSDHGGCIWDQRAIRIYGKSMEKPRRRTVIKPAAAG